MADAALDAEPASPLLALRSNRGRVALGATVGASAVASLDATIASVALPQIGRDLDVDVAGLQWVLTGYLLTLASFILLGGALGDRFGRRRMFLIGSAWFGLASIGCAAAPSIEVLVIARILQGMGGALLTPASLALIQASFRPDDRAPAVGAWSGLGGLAGAVGPFVGGWLVGGPGWRWAFLLNVPVLALSVLAATAIPESGEPRPGEDSHFDVAGAALAALALAATTWALTRAADGWGDSLVLLSLAVGVAAAVAFVVHERRAAAPLVPGEVFRSRTFTVLNLATFALYACLGVVFFLVVFQLQVTAGWTPLAAGCALLPATLLMLVGSAKSGELAARIGPRPQLVAGPLLVAAAMLLLARIDDSTSWATDVLPASLVFGLGLVTFVAPLTATVMASVDERLVSTGSGVNNAVARTAGLLAVAVVPTVSGFTAAVGVDATNAAFRAAMFITAGLAVLGALISAVGLPRTTPTRESSRHVMCPIDGAPLQPDPRRCPPTD